MNPRVNKIKDILILFSSILLLVISISRLVESNTLFEILFGIALVSFLTVFTTFLLFEKQIKNSNLIINIATIDKLIIRRISLILGLLLMNAFLFYNPSESTILNVLRILLIIFFLSGIILLIVQTVQNLKNCSKENMIFIKFKHTRDDIKLNLKSLKRSKLNGQNFHRAILTELNFSYASMKCTNFRNANLLNAQIIGANFEQAKLINADLSNIAYANFNHTNLIGAVLLCERINEATFSGAIFDSSTKWPQGFDPISFGAIRLNS